MIDRYNGGLVPSGERNEVDVADESDLEKYHAAMGGNRGYLLHEAIQAVLKDGHSRQRIRDHKAPWKLAKDPAMKSELDATLASLVRQLARQAVHLYPFIPGKATTLWQALGAPGSPGDQRFRDLAKLSTAGWRVTKTDPLFPKREPAAPGA
jgi:Methionyl-tRNA synthetase